MCAHKCAHKWVGVKAGNNAAAKVCNQKTVHWKWLISGWGGVGLAS